MLEVIIIDDDQIVIFIQKKMIINHQISTNPVSFKKAAKALAYLNEEGADLSKEFLILLDINMPGMSGWEFLDCLENHEQKAKYHVIMVTSSIDNKDKTEAEKYATVRSFIEKPISREDCEQLKNIPEISKFFQKV